MALVLSMIVLLITRKLDSGFFNQKNIVLRSPMNKIATLGNLSIILPSHMLLLIAM
jgi:hypothetical protein